MCRHREQPGFVGLELNAVMGFGYEIAPSTFDWPYMRRFKRWAARIAISMLLASARD